MPRGDILWPLEAHDYNGAWVRWARAGYH